MNKLLYIFAICILLAGCEKNEAPSNVNRSDAALAFVKALSNGQEIVQNEFQYSADGKIKTALGYKDYSKNIISYKRVYSYEDDKLASSEIQMDISSSLYAVNYIYSKTQYEYSNNLIIQSNYLSKKNDQYELTSFTTYTYNDKKLPVKVSRYAAGGSLYAYSTYTYDESGNVILSEDYQLNALGEPVKNMQRSYQYDDKKNPYKNAYTLLENIPYSINQNNITASAWTDYTTNPQGNTGNSITKYNSYNSYGYPTSMDEQGNIFLLEYKW
ncbi:hypothetical protein DC498_14980 [Terrimonas sp.]|uniref:hypothetical protein n=1 Tax=Terrimonas sp. TaxID=1914338 RepID=UPI000D521578|nr:hypothetical protein [Terrimonas sp.]PVD51436.1 hypothetical protein DC498_14980 [Terrimonas sp.]